MVCVLANVVRIWDFVESFSGEGMDDGNVGPSAPFGDRPVRARRTRAALSFAELCARVREKRFWAARWLEPH